MELERITDWRERGARADWSVQTLAKQSGVSRRTLERFFKKQFGLAPKDWLVQARMEQAAQVLMDDATVKTAASVAGYNNPFHFSREFKKHHGYPPSQHATALNEIQKVKLSQMYM